MWGYGNTGKTGRPGFYKKTRGIKQFKPFPPGQGGQLKAMTVVVVGEFGAATPNLESLVQAEPALLRVIGSDRLLVDIAAFGMVE